MKVKNFMKKFSALVLGLGLTLGVVPAVDSNSAHEVTAGTEKTVELCVSVGAGIAYTDDKTFTVQAPNFSGGNTEITIAYKGVYRQGAASTYFQMNKKDGYFKNTVAMPGKITKIETAWSATKNPTTIYFGKTASTVNTKVTVSTGTSVNYAPASSDTNDYYFFNLDVSTGSGSAQMTKCIVHYEEVTASGCEHSWGTGSVTTPATCTTTGVKTYTCSKCSETKTEEIPMLAHNYSYVSNGASGHTKTCSVGGESAPEDHTFGDVVNGSHTCTLCGYNEKYTPPVYGKVTSLTDLPARFIIVDESNSRVFNGNDAPNGYVGVTISDGKITDPVDAAVVEINSIDGGYSVKIAEGGEHVGKYIYGTSTTNTINFGDVATACSITFADGKATILSNSTSFRYNASSGQDRFRFYKTSTTGNSYHLPSLFRYVEPGCQHTNKTLTPEVPATCTETGVEAYYTCSDCDVMLKADGTTEIEEPVVISALGHNPVKVAQVNATTESTGVAEHFKCSRCDQLFLSDNGEVGEETTASELVIPMLEEPHEHIWDSEWSSNSTQHWHACLGGDGCIDQEDLANHSFPEEWSVKVAATFTATGVKHRFCTVCNYEETGVIPVLEDYIDHVSISGAMTKTEYVDGDSWDTTGLVVNKYMASATTTAIQVTEGITWSFSAEKAVKGATSVSVTATVGGKTSESFVVEGLTVAKKPSAYSLVSDASTLETGMKVVITNAKSGAGKGMGLYAGGNNVPEVEFTIPSNSTFAPSALGDVQAYTLEKDANTNTFAFKDKDGKYLNASGGTSSNHLKAFDDADEDSYFTINIGAGGNAIIVCANSSTTKNTIRYNSGSKIFSCYASGQADVYMFALPLTDSATVSFNFGKGSGTLVETNDFEAGDEYTLPTTTTGFTRDGSNYSFVGWATEQGGEAVTTAELHKGENMFYAVWHLERAFTHAGTLADPYDADDAFYRMENPDGNKYYVAGEVANTNFYGGCNFDIIGTSHTVKAYRINTEEARTEEIPNGYNVVMYGTLVSYVKSGVEYAEIIGSETDKIISVEAPLTYSKVTYDGNGVTENVPAQSEDIVFEGTHVVVGQGSMTREGYAFAGWTMDKDGSGRIYQAGDEITVTENITLYALWQVNDEFTHDFLTKFTAGNHSGYGDYSVSKSVEYAGNFGGDNESIQLRSQDKSGLVSTTSNGVIEKVIVTFESHTAADRELDIYGSNVAYTGTADLYDSKAQGTKIEGLVYNGETATMEVSPSDNYQFIGIRSKSGAIYLKSVEIVWQETSVYTVSYDVEGITDAKVYLPGQEVTVTESEPAAREHYEFLGWSIDGETIIDSFEISANTELKAVWKADEGYTENIVVDQEGVATVNECTVSGLGTNAEIASGEKLVITAPKGKTIDVKKLALGLDGNPGTTIMVQDIYGERWEYKPTKSMKPVVEHDLDLVNQVEVTVDADTTLKSMVLLTEPMKFVSSATFNVDYTYELDDSVVSNVVVDKAVLRFGTTIDDLSRIEGCKFGYIIVESSEFDVGESIVDIYEGMFDAADSEYDTLDEILAMYATAKRTTKDSVSALSTVEGEKQYGVKLNVTNNINTQYNIVFYVADANDQVIEFGKEFTVSFADIVEEDYMPTIEFGGIEYQILNAIC